MRCWLGLLCSSVLLATEAPAQTQIGSWNVRGANIWALGQAQDGSVCATVSTLNVAFKYLPNGIPVDASSYGAAPSPWAVESAYHRFLVSDASASQVSLYSGDVPLFRYTYPLLTPALRRCAVGRLVPIEDGKVLVAVECQGQPGSSFHVFDTFVALVDSFAVQSNAGVIGVTRRPDGTIVACTGVAGNPSLTRLKAFTSTGSVLWDVFIGGPGGSVASDPRGAVYVLQNGSVSVYTPDGVFDHVWTGPPGDPLPSFTDIASSLDGTVLFAQVGQTNIRSYGNLPTTVRSMSWGRVKQHYR